MEKIILISGKAEHGKSTAGEMFKKKLESKGKKVVMARSAEHLKRIAKQYCYWDGKKDEAGRELLQYLGTDIIREQMEMPDFHINRLIEDVQISQDYFDYVIVDDVRFLNEIEMTLSAFSDKACSVRLLRVDEEGGDYVSSLSAEQRAHRSEVELDDYEDFDFFATHHSLATLSLSIDYILEKI